MAPFSKSAHLIRGLLTLKEGFRVRVSGLSGFGFRAFGGVAVERAWDIGRRFWVRVRASRFRVWGLGELGVQVSGSGLRALLWGLKRTCEGTCDTKSSMHPAALKNST